jgi:hypothetical protein
MSTLSSFRLNTAMSNGDMLSACKSFIRAQKMVDENLKVLWMPAPGSRPRVFALPNIVDGRFACDPLGSAIFGNQFQSRSFLGTGSVA